MRWKIVAEARSLLGVRYVHQGRSRAGLDCAGLIVLVRNAVLGTSDDFLSYPRRPGPQMIIRTMRQYAKVISADIAARGDIVLMAYGGNATHLGVYTGRSVIHADQNAGRVRELALDVMHRAGGVAQWFRFKGVGAWPRSR